MGYYRLLSQWAICIEENGGYIACHVDHMAAASNSRDDLLLVKSAIHQRLELKELGLLKVYLNINVKDGGSVFFLSQSDYIDKLLREFKMVDAFSTSTPMLEHDRKRWDDKTSPTLSDSRKKLYQAAVGSNLYLMHATRPDLAYTIIHLL